MYCRSLKSLVILDQTACPLLYEIDTSDPAWACQLSLCIVLLQPAFTLRREPEICGSARRFASFLVPLRLPMGRRPKQNRRNIDITLTMACVVSRTYRWHAICIEVQQRYRGCWPPSARRREPSSAGSHSCAPGF